ncbi:MAG TPA: hypothetical protein VFR33_03195 [Candidatus Dormibacteraeota bacterium]|nr:hypothetical protein [Candidatus Dormibacteraeota bacterium]
MGKAGNILAGSIATALVAVGVASLTGTVRWPTFGGPPAAGGVQAQQATESPSPSIEPSPSPSPSPTQAPAPPPPPPAPAPHKKKGH